MQATHSSPSLAEGPPLDSDAPEFSRFDHHPELVSPSFKTRGLTAQKSPNTKQLKFLFEKSILKGQLSDRILRIDPDNEEGRALAKCHEEAHKATCDGCQKSRIFWNRCERRFCPLCAQRLARERKEQLKFWTARLGHPKFLTLTLKNVLNLDSAYIDFVKDRFKKLRRSKLFEKMKGGFWSMEVTNQGNGFHVHLHVLYEGQFIAQRDIEAKWSKLIGQAKSMVHIKAAKDTKYLDELIKYTAKPTEMVNWPEGDLIRYLEIIQGVKLFGVFGDLHGLRNEWTELVQSLRTERTRCECGCNEWTVTLVLEPPAPVHWKTRAGPQTRLFPEWEQSAIRAHYND
jgi:hypothetical protein